MSTRAGSEVSADYGFPDQIEHYFISYNEMRSAF